ncbi:tripartite tricarboxylate transporter substrate binding protein [Polaromonas sp.]|uniref:Bug family tripartite tricarboxylate transporter substrate binding protein n=1 Tax=Polaromonas sp. TaxID=1869339 RepID=UPI0032650A6D
MPTFTRRQLILATTGFTASLAGFGPAFAQTLATPIRVILPVSAGSGLDTIARAGQNALSKQLTQPVVIENLPGAGGIIGTGNLVKAPADGRTIAFVSNNHSVNPSVYRKMPFDSLKDITPICVIGETPFLLVVNPAKLPVKNAKELQAALKAKPDYYNYASSGNGTIIHLAAEMFLDAADVKAGHIPYKGMGGMVTDIISGQVDFGVVAINVAQQHLKNGSLRAVGVMGAMRIASVPDIPTFKEQGFNDMEVGGWFAVVAPKGLPPAEVTRLHKAIVAAWNTAEVKEAMAKQENIVHPMTPEASAQFMKSEQARYARIVQKADIKLD